MSLSTNAKVFSTEFGTSVREKLFDVIANLTPTETLFLTGLSKEPTGNMKFEWLADSTTTFQSNSHYDGEDYAFSALSARTRPSNYCQFFITTFKVGDLINKADQAGLTTEYAYQEMKAAKMHATDIEKAIIYGTSAGISSATASTTRGIDSWISTYSADLSAVAALTEDEFNDLCQDIVTNVTAAPNWVVCSPSCKRQISSFSTPSTRYIDVADKRLVSNVNVYEGDFGVYQIEYCRWLSNTYSGDGDGRVYFIDKSQWSLAVYAETWSKSVPIAAAATAGALHTCLGVKCLAESANGKMVVSNG